MPWRRKPASRFERASRDQVVRRGYRAAAGCLGSRVVNLAPFSAFTFVSPKPPMLAISVGRKAGNRKDLICFSPYLYRARNLIERFFNKIKQCRRVATRYDKLAANYLAFIKLASIRIWLRANEVHGLDKIEWILMTVLIRPSPTIAGR
jgi:transposase